ncbi:MAG: hypothetical protein M1504_02255 [Candidatus Marsarchaeota archaeon]|nr:hypothetical protein [Candidatus Marsarchaeota archaeon]
MAGTTNTITFAITILLFIYNTILGFVITSLIAGTARYLFLILISADYIIIFYFLLGVTKVQESFVASKTGKKKRFGRK